MKASIKLHSFEKETSNGFPIYVKLSHGQNRIKQCIGHSIIEFWNETDSSILNPHPNFFELYPKILNFKALCAKINFGEFSFHEAKQILFSSSNKKMVNGLLAFFDIRINEKKMLGEPFKSYLYVKNAVKNYTGGEIALNDITYEWLNEFTLYKLNNGCGVGGVNSYLRTLRAVYKEAQRRESLNVKKDNPFMGVFKKGTKRKIVEVSKEHMISLINFTPKKALSKENAFKMKRNIAVWLFQFYVGGHDYIDVSLLTWDSISSGRISFKRYKNRNKAGGGPLIDNLLSKQALAIIEKYGTKENDRIFGFIPNAIKNDKLYTNHRRSVSRSLESISKRLQFDFIIKTKTPRYIFRTYATEVLTHDLIVMRLQGHKPEGITYKYQGNISYQLIDDALLKIITIN